MLSDAQEYVLSLWWAGKDRKVSRIRQVTFILTPRLEVKDSIFQDLEKGIKIRETPSSKSNIRQFVEDFLVKGDSKGAALHDMSPREFKLEDKFIIDAMRLANKL